MKSTNLITSILLVTLLLLFASCKNENKDNAASDEDDSIDTKNTPIENFEGTIHYEFTAMGHSYTKTFMFKGDYVRVDSDGDHLFLLPKKNTMIAFREGEYVEMDLSDYYVNPSDVEVTTKNTGKTKTIAGTKCEVWEVQAEGTLITLCLSKNLGNFTPGANTLSGIFNPKWMSENDSKNYMPLEAIMVSVSLNTSVNAFKIERKPLNDSLFKIPKDVRKIESPMSRYKNMQKK